jgi:hypothetical protein
MGEANGNETKPIIIADVAPNFYPARMRLGRLFWPIWSG